MPGYFHGDTRVYIHRKNPSMWEIIHMHANPRVIFRTREYHRENTRPGMEMGVRSPAHGTPGGRPNLCLYYYLAK